MSVQNDHWQGAVAELMQFDRRDRSLTPAGLQQCSKLLESLRSHLELPWLCDKHAAEILDDVLTDVGV